ncbi:hypothetical protein [Nonomuraea sp. NPDC050643]|uniref:hypothetical protein n=1 Tax=Nonomuraea sp. NPDC050643 TaxID=3155660 RepID=UPI0033EE1094
MGFHRQRKLGQLAVLLTTAATASVLLGSSPAQAAPTNCSFDFYNTSLSSYAQCRAGTGQFRAKLRCDIPWSSDRDVYGNWLGITSPPGNSIAICPSNARRGFNPGIETR